jgi:hypothetical protein
MQCQGSKRREQVRDPNNEAVLEFHSWLDRAQPGDTYIYGRATAHTHADPATRDAAYKAYLAGRVELVQRRIGPVIHHVLDYIAIKRAVVRPVFEKVRF